MWEFYYFIQGCGVTYLGLLPGGKMGLSRAPASTTRSRTSNIHSLDPRAKSPGNSGLSLLPLLFSWWRNSGQRRRSCLPWDPPGPFYTPVLSSGLQYKQTVSDENRSYVNFVLQSIVCIYTQGWDGGQVFPQAWEDESMLDRGTRAWSFALHVCENP